MALEPCVFGKYSNFRWIRKSYFVLRMVRMCRVFFFSFIYVVLSLDLLVVELR